MFTMSTNQTLKAVKAGELKIDEAIAKAKSDASKLTADAHRKASDLLGAANDEASEVTRTILDSARASAQGDADNVIAEGNTAVSSLGESAEKAQESAIALILDSIQNA